MGTGVASFAESVETGIRIKGALCAAVVAEASSRNVSMETIARFAMRNYALQFGIQLLGGGHEGELRDHPNKNADRRKLWVRYPRKWRALLREMLEANDELTHISDLWRGALVKYCREHGTTLKSPFLPAG